MAKKSDVGFLTGLVIAGVFIVAAVLFTLVQYKAILLEYNGFEMAFGKKIGSSRGEGDFLFFLPFLFAVIGAGVAILAALKVFKVKGSMLFGILALLAVVSAILYIVKYSSVNDNVLSSQYTWSFAFWGGFGLNCIAAVGAVFGIVKAK